MNIDKPFEGPRGPQAGFGSVDFSILTPSYQYGRFLTSAIQSVRSQAGPKEHVVMDGGSSDETLSVLEREAWDGLTWRSESDAGQSQALNKAFRLAQGEIIGWLNADEFYLPGAIESARNVFVDHPEVDVVFGDVIFVDLEAHLVRAVCSYPLDSTVLRRRGCIISSATAFIRKSALPGEPWDEGLRFLMDWDLFLYLDELMCNFYYLKRPVAAFRLHPGQVTHSGVDPDGREHSLLGERYDLNPRLSALALKLGIQRHRWHKLASGALSRERSISELRGISMLGREGVADASWRRLLTSYDEGLEAGTG